MCLADLAQTKAFQAKWRAVARDCGLATSLGRGMEVGRALSPFAPQIPGKFLGKFGGFFDETERGMSAMRSMELVSQALHDDAWG